MKKGSYLLNAARGKCVQIEAVAKALQTHHLAGAYFDVYPSEPTDKTLSLIDCPNCILTPHIGGSTLEAQNAIGLELAMKITRFINEGCTTGAVNFPEISLKPNTTSHRILHVHRNVPGVLRVIIKKIIFFFFLFFFSVCVCFFYSQNLRRNWKKHTHTHKTCDFARFIKKKNKFGLFFFCVWFLGKKKKINEITAEYNVTQQSLGTVDQIGYLLIELSSQKQLSQDIKKNLDQLPETIRTRVLFSPGAN